MATKKFIITSEDTFEGSTSTDRATAQIPKHTRAGADTIDEACEVAMDLTVAHGEPHVIYQFIASTVLVPATARVERSPEPRGDQ